MTQVFKTYEDFLRREDKSINGVSPDFAENHPNYRADNSSNTGCWNCVGCSNSNGCRECKDCKNCSYCTSLLSCRDCTGCEKCSYCERLSDCSYCESCFNMSYANNTKGRCVPKHESVHKELLDIPIIKDIHQKVLKAVSQPKALNMAYWHTCDTTHCRAGWVVFLAGKEGKSLEKATSTSFAALQIYKESSGIPVSTTRFFEEHDVAMKDIIRCAEEELKTPINEKQTTFLRNKDAKGPS